MYIYILQEKPPNTRSHSYKNKRLKLNKISFNLGAIKLICIGHTI